MHTVLNGTRRHHVAAPVWALNLTKFLLLFASDVISTCLREPTPVANVRLIEKVLWLAGVPYVVGLEVFCKPVMNNEYGLCIKYVVRVIDYVFASSL